MKKSILGVCAGLLLSGYAIAQDVHFTQYFTSPLTLNPAMTGLVDDDIRIAADYRSQWSSVSANPYTTGTISIDIATLRGKLPEGDALGLGLLGLYDKSGSGALTNETVGLSFAYHKGLGREKDQHLSIGFQGYLVQKTIDFQSLTWEDEFDPASGTFKKNTTQEKNSNADIAYPDFNLGIMYSGRVRDHATAYIGGSYYHLTQPVETFLHDPVHQVHSRYTGYLGGSFDLNENTILYASGLYQSQASATEVLVGAAVGFILNPGHDMDFQKNTVLYLGAWYRNNDALSPYVSIEWSKMRIGFTYDVNISNFMPATGGLGGYEISLVFFGRINKRTKNPTYNWACPRLY